MKEFFDDIKSIIEESKNKEDIDIVEEKAIKEEIIREERELKKEIYAESKKEIRHIVIIALIVIFIIIIFLFILYINRKNVANSFQKFMNNTITQGNTFIDKNKNLLPIISNTYKINCSNNYSATYNGEYTLNDQTVKENLSLHNDGSYAKSENDSTSSGKYFIDNKTITLSEESYTNTSSANYKYIISNDCKTISRTLSDGTTIVLKTK